jgi:hypothetical protein
MTGRNVKNVAQTKLSIQFESLPDADKIELSKKFLHGAIESIEIESLDPISNVLKIAWAIATAYNAASEEIVIEPYSEETAQEKTELMSEREQALKEIDDFYANLPRLLKKYEGKYVAYADGKVYLSGDDEAKVAEAFFSKFGRKPACIAKVQAEEPTYYVPSPFYPAQEG